MSLLELVEQKQQKFLQQREDSQSEEAAWQEAVKALYQQIITWLKPLANRGLVKLFIKPMPTDSYYDEDTGDMELRDEDHLIIKFFNGEAIKLMPVGLNVIGAYGRVDMAFGLRKIMIIQKEKNGEWIFTERDGLEKSPVFPLNQVNFEQLVSTFIENF